MKWLPFQIWSQNTKQCKEIILTTHAFAHKLSKLQSAWHSTRLISSIIKWLLEDKKKNITTSVWKVSWFSPIPQDSDCGKFWVIFKINAWFLTNLHDLVDEGWKISPFEGPLSAGHLIQDAAQRPDVWFLIVGLPFTLQSQEIHNLTFKWCWINPNAFAVVE